MVDDLLFCTHTYLDTPNSNKPISVTHKANTAAANVLPVILKGSTDAPHHSRGTN